MLALLLDFWYGILNVVLHAILIREDHAQTNGVVTSGSRGFSGYSISRNHWLVQFVDLDLSWGHRLMGFSDFPCLIAGLIYGIVVIVVVAFTINSLCGRTEGTAWVARWFVVFAHFQLVAYLAVNLAKYPQLCKLRREFYPSLEATCDVLRFAFVERCAFGLFLASMVLWIVGSFAYLTARGLDPDNLSDDDEEAGMRQYVLPPIVQNHSLPTMQTFPMPISSAPLPSFNTGAPVHLPYAGDARGFVSNTTPISRGYSGATQPIKMAVR